MDVQRIVDPAFDVNIYCVMEEEALVVDSGTGLRAPEVIQQVRTALGDTPFRHLVLTHRHIDHVGGASAMTETFGVPPHISPDDAPPLRTGDQASIGALLFGTTVGPLEVEALDYGDQISLGDTALKVLHSPGHTIGSICLLADNGALFTGDTAFAYGGIGRWDLDTGSYEDLLASLKRLDDLGAEDLYPGHGPAIRGEAATHLHLAVEMAEASGP